MTKKKKHGATKFHQTLLKTHFLKGKSLGFSYMLIIFRTNPGNIDYVYATDVSIDATISRSKNKGGVFEIYDLRSPIHPQLLQRRAWNVTSIRREAARSLS